jgi:hypothetical protein
MLGRARLGVAWGVSVLSSALLSNSPAAAKDEPLRPDQWPPGRAIPNALERPKLSSKDVRVCSFAEPVCVHGVLGVQDIASPSTSKGAAPIDASEVLADLALAERFVRVFRRMGLPLPRPDGAAGGSADLDLYVSPALSPQARATYRVGIEPAESFPVDRAPAFAIVAAGLPAGCARETAVARVVATAMLAAVDAGETGGTIAASASYLAWEATGCVPWEAIDDAQRRPEEPMIPVTALDDPGASPLLPFYLDTAFNAEVPGSLYVSLFRASGQSTSPPALRYANKDLFATLARVAKGSGKTIADVLVDAAIARAFHGDREDGLHVPASAALGAFGRPRFDASLRYDALPKRISFAPLEPTGITYTWVDLSGAPKDAGVIVSMAWERPVTLRWSVVRVGADGQELSRVDLTREPGVFEVQRTILQLQDSAALLIVGVSVGEVNPADPFKADEAPYEPHGGTVYVLRQTDVP